MDLWASVDLDYSRLAACCFFVHFKTSLHHLPSFTRTLRSVLWAAKRQPDFFFPFWVNSSFKSGIKQEWSGGNMSWYLTLVVNCTPVLMMRGFCGCVGMHGCFSTTNELRNKPHLQWFTQFCSSHHFLHLEGLWFCLFSDSFQYGVTCC